MHINLAELFSRTVTDVTVNHEFMFEEIAYGSEVYSLHSPIGVHMAFSQLGNKDFLARGTTKAALIMPCNRCMVDVIKEVETSFVKEFKMDSSVDEIDFHDYIKGSVLDVEKLVLDEIYMNVPIKVLCSEGCLGFCKSCGKDLNHRTCDCEDDNVDPRLAGLKDLFNNQFKEV